MGGVIPKHVERTYRGGPVKSPSVAGGPCQPQGCQLPLSFEGEINPGYSPDLATQSRILLESQLMINPSCILDSSVFAMPLSCKPYARDPSYTWIVSRCFENSTRITRGCIGGTAWILDRFKGVWWGYKTDIMRIKRGFELNNSQIHVLHEDIRWIWWGLTGDLCGIRLG